MQEKKCRQIFSTKIGENMRKMRHEKTRPQIIAISARETVSEYSQCKRFLDRPKERIELVHGFFIYMSSKSFRLYRSKPCCIRIFFNKSADLESSSWWKILKQLIMERFHIVIKKKPIVNYEKYIEMVIEPPALIIEILRKRIANFLD